MKYRFSTETLTYVTNFLVSLAHGDSAARPQRRNLLRLANKFAPPRTNVDLKPADKMQVTAFFYAGLQMLAELAEKEPDQAKKDHCAKIFGHLEEVLNKFEGKRPPEYEVAEPTPESTDAAS